MVEIIQLFLDETHIENNLTEIANTARTLLYNENPEYFDLIDVDDDMPFLEPSVFYYFSYRQFGFKTPLIQSLWGYMHYKKRPNVIEVVSDGIGIINLPNYGYYKYQPNKTLKLEWNSSTSKITFYEDQKPVTPIRVDEKKLKKSNIRICLHETDLLTTYNNAKFVEPVYKTAEKFESIINNAWSILNSLVPDFCKLIELTTKEIVIFNSLNQESKASFGYFGTAFLNVKNEAHCEAFFIDDIAHQCGHVLFYALTMPPEQYFKPPPRTPINVFTHVDWEKRDIYGCLHGLFTYTTILYCLDKFLEKGSSNNRLMHEATGRLAFYMNKFRRDIAVMNDPQILTKEGFQLFDMFKAGYELMYSKYKQVIRNCDFSNQTYIFNYKLYASLNAELLYI